MIKVNNKEIEYKKEMTVEEALRLVGEGTDKMVIVSVNGVIIPNSKLNSTTITDNTEILLLPLISGG